MFNDAFKALADHPQAYTRPAACRGRIDCGALAEQFDIQADHVAPLHVLKEAGLVKSRREGQQISIRSTHVIEDVVGCFSISSKE